MVFGRKINMERDAFYVNFGERIVQNHALPIFILGEIWRILSDIATLHKKRDLNEHRIRL